jgi:putative ABC transport system permease protein
VAAALLCAGALVSSPRVVVGQGEGAATLRTVALDARLAADHGVRVGDTVRLSATPDGPGRAVIVGALLARGADPSEVARSEYRARLHLTQLQDLLAYGDRVDRFAVATPEGPALDSAVARINAAAFGFRAHRSRDVAVETSATFAVLTRFQRAIGLITIVASATFLLCIMLLKVEERRRDVAALRMLGLSRRTVVGAVVVEATVVALVGSALGAGLGAVISRVVNGHYQSVYRTPLVFSLVTPGTVALAVGLSVVIGVLAGLLASLRLVRRRPLSLLGR